MENLIYDKAPHIHSHNSTQKIMLDVLIALLPATVASVVIFGVKALTLTIVCVVSAVISEYVFNLITKRKQTIIDLSACVTGLLLALNLSTNVELWQAAIGSIFAIIVVKNLFGGLGNNFANPAITARIFMILAFSTVPGGSQPKGADLVSSATPLELIGKEDAVLPTLKEMFLGLRGGTIGETCILALLIGYIYLVIRKDIKWYVPLTFIVTVFVLFFVARFDFTYALYEILAGGLFLGAIFMVTDYVTTPITNKGKVYFCFGCGIITFVIRYFLSYPEGVSFSILIMNILTPYIEKISHKHPLGGI